MWGKPRRNQITATLCCERFSFYNQQPTTHPPPPHPPTSALPVFPPQVKPSMGSDQGSASLLPGLWYICHEDEDDYICVMVMVMVMMMITLHDPLECIKCEYSSIVNRLQAQSDIQLPRPIARSQFLERASLFCVLSTLVFCVLYTSVFSWTCYTYFVKVRSSPPHDGTIITEKNATMVTSSSSYLGDWGNEKMINYHGG